MSSFYDRNGNPMLMKAWTEAFEDGPGRRIAETKLPNGLWVSTVWLGIDHSFGGVRPLIFESMVFDQSPVRAPMMGRVGAEMDQRRYATEDEARAGHEALVAEWKAWTAPAVDQP